MEVMNRLDTLERQSNHEIRPLNDQISDLKKDNRHLCKENQLLREDNECLRNTINNYSSDNFLPSSTDQKDGSSANTYNSRQYTRCKAGVQKGHKGTILTKKKWHKKRAEKCRHEIREIGNTSSGKYFTKYVVDLDIAPLVTEIRIYADADGTFSIPEEYRSDVIYGANVEAVVSVLYSEGVMSNDRIVAFLNAAGSDELGLSAGIVYGFCKKLAQNVQHSIQPLEECKIRK